MTRVNLNTPRPCGGKRSPRRGKRAIEPAKTGDVQLGKLIEDGPEDYYPWA